MERSEFVRFEIVGIKTSNAKTKDVKDCDALRCSAETFGVFVTEDLLKSVNDDSMRRYVFRVTSP
jgi:hypothetical protein